jgi:CDP-diglyceride synthetase
MFEHLHPGLILQITSLIIWANGSPVLAKRIFGGRLAYPLDGGLILYDGARLFGPSKTIRGVLASVIVTSVASALMRQGPILGIVVALAAMTGDLISSFIKRRLGYPASSRATGLDQVPESLLPLLACRTFIPLSGIDILATLALFVLGGIILSPLLHSAHIRDEPY